MFQVLVQQLLQFTVEQVFVADVELYHPLEVGRTVDIDMVAVEPQFLAGFMGQLHLHLDLDVTAAQDKAEFILFVITALRKRPAKAVLTGETGYSAGRATRQGSSSLTRFTGQSAITFSTCRR